MVWPMRNWKQIASGLNLDVPESDVEKIAPVMDGLEAAFRPLAGKIPHDVEPAVVFQIVPEDQA